MSQLIHGMVQLKTNRQQQKVIKNLATLGALAEAVNPVLKYEREKREKAAKQSKQ